MRRKLSNLIVIIIIFAKQLLEIAGAIMDIIGLPELSEKIELLIEKHSGNFDALTIMFFFGVVALIILNWNSIVNFFKWATGSKIETQEIKKEPVASNNQHDPFADFIEECKQCDPSYNSFSRKVELIVPYVIAAIEKMRRERTVYSFSMLEKIAFSFRRRGLIENHKEIRYVLGCLKTLRYIDIEIIPDTRGRVVLGGEPSAKDSSELYDKSIKFSDKYISKFGNLIFQ